MREIITLECSVCRQRNYTMTHNKRKHPERLATKKFCRFCNAHTEHKQTK